MACRPLLTDDFPTSVDLGTGPLSVEPYISPDYFEAERRSIFRRCWLNVARDIEVPAVGDYVVRDVEICGASVIIVRGKDGNIRAFHNVCSHRSARLVWDEAGSARVFTCPYHAWAYGLDGALRGVPGQAGFRDLDKSTCGLTPVACDVWNGLIFVNFAGPPPTSLRDYLGSLAGYGDDYPFDELDAAIKVEVSRVECNWKTLLDAFQEVYHLNILHRQTLTTLFKSASNPLCDPLCFRTFGPHRSVSIGFNPEHQVGRVEKLSQRYAGNLTTVSGEARERAKRFLAGLGTTLNPTGDPTWAMDVNIIFPNVVWLASAGTAVIHRFWPIDVDSTRYEAISYYPRPRTVSERFSREFGFGVFRDTIAEDILNVEHSQRAMQSGAKRHIHLQDAEIAIRHHLHVVNDFVSGKRAYG